VTCFALIEGTDKDATVIRLNSD